MLTVPVPLGGPPPSFQSDQLLTRAGQVCMGQGSEGKRIAQQELSGFSRRPRGWSQGVRAGNRELQTLRCHHRPLTGHQPHPHSFVFQKLFRSPGTVSGHTVDTTQVLAPSFWPQVARAIGGIARQLGRQWGGGHSLHHGNCSQVGVTQQEPRKHSSAGSGRTFIAVRT